MATENTSTREEILYILKTQGAMPVSDIAQQLGITEMAVRRHLNTLERDQYLKTERIRQAMGRPTNVYSLTEKGDEVFPRNYSDITLDFLKDIEELEGKSKVQTLFKRREERLETNHRTRMEGLTFEEKVQTLANIQNDKGYMVQWEKQQDDRYVFQEYNCPIAHVAKEYNEACNCELSLFQKLLGTEHVERTECLAKGGKHCKYIIQESRSS
ncbi:ArsR family transcriptional regulator [Caldalkalibacillus salinus]|uniref:ArsR family transcriptional regulator n=1 Tax=Caldalkalibacillus salinus TaxID=2803787 RepID=UPI001922159A